MHAELALAAGAEKGDDDRTKRNAQTGCVKSWIPQIFAVEGNTRHSVLELTEGCGADVAIVACSAGAAQRDAQSIIAKRGRISLFGGLPGEGTGFGQQYHPL